MRWPLRLLAVLFCGWLAFKPIARASDLPIVSATPTPHQPTECDQLWLDFTARPGWFEQLVNPTLTSSAAVEQTLEEFTALYECLGGSGGEDSEEVVLIRTLLEYYLIFAGGYHTPEGQSYLDLIAFAECQDPAIIALRDQVGIPPPTGYVFVRYYASRAAMPTLIRQAFENPDVAGVTILIRYVAVLVEDTTNWQERALQHLTLPGTISHELVHAYINSTLGFAGIDLPDWYHEGLAIYFSGNGESHTVIAPDLTVSRTPPQAYRRYQANFQFLEAELGKERLYQRIKTSLDSAQPSDLYSGLMIGNDQAFFERVSAWQQRRAFLKIGIFSLVIVLIVLGVIRIMPEVRCQNCDYAGKRREFESGYCPKCHRRYDRKSLW
jgi:hypothetical protein